MIVEPMIPTMQHRDALFSLSVIEAALGVLHPASHTDPVFNLRCGNVRRWLDRSAEELHVERIVSGAKRDLDAMCVQLAPHLPGDEVSGEELLAGWGAIYWTGFTLLLGARQTCPLYVKGHNWRWLIQTGWTLGHLLMELSPGCDIHGTDIYLEM